GRSVPCRRSATATGCRSWPRAEPRPCYVPGHFFRERCNICPWPASCLRLPQARAWLARDLHEGPIGIVLARNAMRHTDVRSQLDTAFGNVESALRNLSDRLDEVLPDYGGRRRVQRAGRALRRKAHEVAERVRPQRGGDLVEDTRRTIREHPLGTVVTAALVGGLVWAV